MEREASEALASAHGEAKQEAGRADVEHADATSWANGAVKRSLWVIAALTASVFGIFVNGTHERVQPFFGAWMGILGERPCVRSSELWRTPWYLPRKPILPGPLGHERTSWLIGRHLDLCQASGGRVTPSASFAQRSPVLPSPVDRVSNPSGQG